MKNFRSSILNESRVLVNDFLGLFSYNHRLLTNLSFPKIFAIESTNICNLECPMCPRKDMKRKIGIMKLSLFKKIIDESYPYTKFLWLHLFGEPLFNPKLNEMIEYCNKKGISTGISTNATLLDKNKSEEILNSGLDQLIISMDGATKETYEKFRKGSDFDRTTTNIINFLRIKNERELPKPFTSIQIIKMKGTENEIDPFIKFWEGKTDEVCVKDFIRFANQANYVHESMIDNHKPRRSPRYPCKFFWQYIIILWDGTVVPCCFDYYGKVVLGNLNEETLLEIWRGEKIKHYKKQQLSGNFSNNDLCVGCIGYPGEPSSLSYSLNLSSLNHIKSRLIGKKIWGRVERE